MGNASTMEIVAGAVRAGTDQQDITQNAHIHHNLNTKACAKRRLFMFILNQWLSDS